MGIIINVECEKRQISVSFFVFKSHKKDVEKLCVVERLYAVQLKAELEKYKELK